MKYVCLNYQNCFYYHYITEEDEVDYDQPYGKCPECNSLTVLVSNDFNIDECLDTPLIQFIPEEE